MEKHPSLYGASEARCIIGKLLTSEDVPETQLSHMPGLHSAQSTKQCIQLAVTLGNQAWKDTVLRQS